MELVINAKLKLVNSWLCSNKLSLIISKSNFVIFHPSQKKGSIYCSTNYLQPTTVLTEEKSIQYLGIIIDSNLEWKQHVNYLTNRIKDNIGLLSKIRYFVNQSTLVSLYYAFIYPYFT